jgi:2-hydroxy-4-carboxymuconate semialdehyde hemiacetal dehydrogenase
MKIIIAGSGSIARQHLAAIKNIADVEVVTLLGTDEEELKEVSAEYDIKNWSTDEKSVIRNSDAQAIILCTPTPLHAQQTIAWLKAGKHVLVEIPMGVTLDECREIVATQKETGKVAMVAHTRRFNPPHQWLHQQFKEGKLHLHHLVVETLFHRRDNVSALGKKRDWVDHLLWHHACHSVDLFGWQIEGEIIKRWAQQGPISDTLGIPLDMTIGLRSETAQIATIALSFNNEGPLGSWFRYICEEGTFKVRYNEMTDGWDNPVNYDWKGVSDDGIELQDREFFEAITEKRAPRSSVEDCFNTMEILHKLEYLSNN